MAEMDLALGIFSSPLAANAQESQARMARIGFLATGSLAIPKSAHVFRVFRESLRDLGYVEGQNLAIEYRGAAGKPDGLPPTSATGTGWERTPWRAVQSAAWDALKKAEPSG